jgi:hypothetical protein
MTNTTTGNKVSAQDALAAAEAAYRSTQHAVESARAAASRQALDAAETAAAEAIAAAVLGEGDRATADAARENVEKMRRDFEWAEVELQAAELAMSRAADDAARAQRAVTAQEWLAAHNEHNNPRARVNVLLTQLTDTLAELVPLVAARDRLHRRLEQERHHFPADERFTIPPGQPLTALDARALPNIKMEVPRGAIAAAIDAGIAAARQ